MLCFSHAMLCIRFEKVVSVLEKRKIERDDKEGKVFFNIL